MHGSYSNDILFISEAKCSAKVRDETIKQHSPCAKAIIFVPFIDILFYFVYNN